LPKLDNIKHVFFDLDKTLWDFDENSRQALIELYELNTLKQFGVHDFEKFYSHYSVINDDCWEQYRNNQMTKSYLRHQRFYLTLLRFGIDSRSLAKKIGVEYVEISPTKNKLIEGTTEILNYLSDKYALYIITNGFQEVQHLKLKNTGIDHFFKDVITSERVGRRKPDPQIFDFAIRKSGGTVEESVMIGDDFYIDVKGAADVGIKSIWFNPHQKKVEESEKMITIQLLDEIKLYL
jgi:putative hydrolase of the HAD superfamily